MRRANERWQHPNTSPSWVYWSAGAIAHPGSHARTALGSGIRRKSPTGPPTVPLLVNVSTTVQTLKIGLSPTPERSARSKAAIGTPFTRATPALSTIVTAITLTPRATSSSKAPRASEVLPD